MSLSRVVATAWRENLLFSVLVELTYRCNLDCFFCYNDLGLKGEPLSRAQYYRLFDELRDLQVLHLTLSGGEPLAHPDFLALGARARELGFAVRHIICDAASYLLPDNAAVTLAECGPARS